MFCSSCGNQLSEGSAFCSRCGAQVGAVAAQAAAVVYQPQIAEEVSPKSRLATTLLAVFLGWAGAHRFYMGKTATATVMLLLGIAACGCYFAYVGGVMMSASTSGWQESDAPLFWMLLLFLSGLFGLAVGIWALVDFIIAVTGGFKDNQGKPIKKW